MVETLFYFKPPLNRLLKTCSNGSGPLIKIAIMYMYAINLLKLLLSRKHLKLEIKHWELKAYQIFQMMSLVTFLRNDQIDFLIHACIRENIERTGLIFNNY